MKLKRKRKLQFHNMTVMMIVVVIIVLAGVFLPGILINAQKDNEYNNVAKVPKEYLPSSSVMSKDASLNLKLTERLQLINNQWNSTTEEISEYDMDNADYQIVDKARKEVEKLYNSGLYPTNINPKYSNWYSWKVTPYKAVDNTFNTYTAYYWKIEFEKYDNSEQHTVWMLDDGTLILVKASMPENIGQDKIKKLNVAYKTDNAASIFDYSGIDFSNMQLIGKKIMSDSQSGDGANMNTDYVIVQFLGEKEYVYGIGANDTHVQK